MTIDPSQYVVGPDAEVSDIDLDKEEFCYPGGRLTEERAQQLADEYAKRPGRPSLTGRAAHTPRLGVRVPDDVRARLQQRAEREHKSISAVIREAIEQYV